jgi:hypothetical protein
MNPNQYIKNNIKSNIFDFIFLVTGTLLLSSCGSGLDNSSVPLPISSIHTNSVTGTGNDSLAHKIQSLNSVLSSERLDVISLERSVSDLIEAVPESVSTDQSRSLRQLLNEAVIVLIASRSDTSATFTSWQRSLGERRALHRFKVTLQSLLVGQPQSAVTDVVDIIRAEWGLNSLMALSRVMRCMANKENDLCTVFLGGDL